MSERPEWAQGTAWLEWDFQGKGIWKASMVRSSGNRTARVFVNGFLICTGEPGKYPQSSHSSPSDARKVAEAWLEAEE